MTAWTPNLDWNAPAGKLLDELAALLPTNTVHSITVFGSAPLQLALDSAFLSADVDVISPEDLGELIRAHSLGKDQRPLYLEQCQPGAFVTASDWPARAFHARRKSVNYCFPHPMDLLVSKLQRLEKKDLEAFRLVCGRRLFSEDDFRTVLMNAVDIYRPRFAEEQSGADIFENTRAVWQEIYGKAIDVRLEIVIPALAKRKPSHGAAAPNWKAQLSHVAGPI
jgi:hypothetical protein